MLSNVCSTKAICNLNGQILGIMAGIAYCLSMVIMSF